MVDIQSPTAKIRRKKDRKKERRRRRRSVAYCQLLILYEYTIQYDTIRRRRRRGKRKAIMGQKYNVRICYAGLP